MICKIKVLINIAPILYKLLEQLQRINRTLYRDLSGTDDDAPKSGNIYIDIDSSGSYSHNEVYWAFKVGESGRIQSQTVGSAAIKGGSVYQSSAWQEQFYIDSDVSDSTAYSGRRHWQINRHTKIIVWVPKNSTSLAINVRIQDYKGGIVRSDLVKTIPTP